MNAIDEINSADSILCFVAESLCLANPEQGVSLTPEAVNGLVSILACCRETLENAGKILAE